MGFLSGLASFAGPILSFASGKQTNSANKQAASDANDFTAYMMGNRHQLEVADLKAAGLNPVLSAGGVPSMGGSAVADVINPADSAIQATNSALAARRLTEEINNIRADTELKKDSAVAQIASARAANSAAALTTTTNRKESATVPFTDMVEQAGQRASNAANSARDLKANTMRYFSAKKRQADMKLRNKRENARNNFKKLFGKGN